MELGERPSGPGQLSWGGGPPRTGEQGEGLVPAQRECSLGGFSAGGSSAQTQLLGPEKGL